MTNTLEKRTRKHRAVAPVIATLLMVAIAVVGGTIIFVFSQGFFNQAQVSGTPTIESVKILGYDARDIASLIAHDGITMGVAGSDPNAQGKNVGEYVVVYIKNDSSAGGSVAPQVVVNRLICSAFWIGRTPGVIGTRTPSVSTR